MTVSQPLLLATWSFGRTAVAAGWPHLVRPGGGSLDAVEQAVRAVEADPACMTVGCGGYPDAAGEVTLDASIMLSPARCGSVCFVRRFMHPVSIARIVMEHTPHVMLAGDGAERLARSRGMLPADLLTEASRKAYEKWLAEQGGTARTPAAPAAGAQPRANIEEVRPAADDLPHNRRHDTVGVLALDSSGVLAGACSTSGLPFKLPGRVGDSPIIGHGLYVDPRHGAAVATGHGELIMGICATFLAVEEMRRGASPAEASACVIRRIIESYRLRENHQVGVIALATDGRWSSAALRPGFKVALKTADRDELVDAGQVLLGPQA
jgi:isoaspartyl peptidase/L-asparaginase-like protein (Ntn-hydrolase superfamily)